MDGYIRTHTHEHTYGVYDLGVKTGTSLQKIEKNKHPSRTHAQLKGMTNNPTIIMMTINMVVLQVG